MQCELMQGIPKDDLDVILSFFKQRRIFSGSIFIHKGEPGDEMFIIFSGKVDVKIGGKTIKKLSKNHIIGEVCLTQPGSPRTADLLAETDLVLFGINAKVMDQIAMACPQSVALLWKNIARIEGRRLRDTNDRLEKTTRDLEMEKRAKSELEGKLLEATRSGFEKIKKALISAIT